MHVYDWLKEVVNTSEAWRIEVDLNMRTLLFDSIPILQNGTLCVQSIPMPGGTDALITGLISYLDDPYTEVERLYAQFKRSVPSKSERLNRGCFKACSSDQLSYAELNQNMPRQEARVLLEGFILLATCAGILIWMNPKHFFWQGADPDLILYRDWIQMEEKQDEKQKRGNPAESWNGYQQVPVPAY